MNSRFALVLLALCMPAAGADRDAYLAFGNNPFTGRYTNGHFIADKSGMDDNALRSLLKRFPVGSVVNGYSADGRKVRVVIAKTQMPSGHLGDELLTLTTDKNDLSPANVLVWTAHAPLTILKPERSAITQSVDKDLRTTLSAHVQKLVARRYREPWEKPETFSIGQPEVLSIPGSDILAISYPVSVQGETPPTCANGSIPMKSAGNEIDYDRAKKEGCVERSWTDDRGSGFFLQSRKTKRTVFWRFGHPEWSSGADESDVLNVRPVLFFRVANDKHTYMLAEWTCAWECIGHAIVDYETGKALVHTR